MEISATFAAPAATDRKCVECERAVFGPPNTICADCALAGEEAQWMATVEVAYRAARDSIPSKFRDVTFKTPGLHGDRVKRAQAVRTACDAGLRAVTCALVGASAAGKTSLAVAMLRMHLDEASSSKFPRSLGQVTRDLARMHRASSSRYARAYSLGITPEWDNAMREFREADLLIIDDLGLEKVSFAETIVDIVIARDGAKRKTVVATSLDDDAIERRYGEGFRRRLQEEVPPIRCDAP